MKNLRQKKWFRVFIRQIISAGIIALIGFIGELDPVKFASLITVGVPALNRLLKYLNTTYFGDLGVAKPIA